MSISFAEAVARTSMSFDQQIANALDQSALVLADRGATATELAAFQAEYKIELEEWKVASLGEIIRGLSDWDAPSGKLQ